MEQLKHECGVAMIRLRKPLRFYKEKYGTYSYALNLLYLMMEKQHNRGQEAAGVGVVKIDTAPGNEYIFRERALGTNAITEIFATIGNQLEQCHIAEMAEDDIAQDAPFIGNVYMGHLRYSTTGKAASHSFTHSCAETIGGHATCSYAAISILQMSICFLIK